MASGSDDDDGSYPEYVGNISSNAAHGYVLPQAFLDLIGALEDPAQQASKVKAKGGHFKYSTKCKLLKTGAISKVGGRPKGLLDHPGSSATAIPSPGKKSKIVPKKFTSTSATATPCPGKKSKIVPKKSNSTRIPVGSSDSDSPVITKAQIHHPPKEVLYGKSHKRKLGEVEAIMRELTSLCEPFKE